MDILVVGAGRVGLLTAACLAEKGHSVACLDADAARIDLLSKGHIPFCEPLLPDLVQHTLANGQLHFTADWAVAMRNPQVVFIAVGSPAAADGSADLSQVEAVSADIGRNLRTSLHVVVRTTVPVGTCERVGETVCTYNPTKYGVSLAYNPEFMREGSAVSDFLHPERVVVGVDCEATAQVMKEVYHWVESPFVITDIRSAELIKHAANAFLALKLSYINCIARLCELCGGDIKTVSRGLAMDSRIGPAFLSPGIGYGGPCIPKDVRAFVRVAESFGYDLKMVKAAEEVNDGQRQYVVEMTIDSVGDLADKTIAVYGLTFKAGTDELAESPAVDVARRLQAQGALVVAYDPSVTTPRAQLQGIEIAPGPIEAAVDSDAQLFLTDWPEFKSLDFGRIREVARAVRVIDARNMFDRSIMREAGIAYRGIGVAS